MTAEAVGTVAALSKLLPVAWTAVSSLLGVHADGVVDHPGVAELADVHETGGSEARHFTTSVATQCMTTTPANL